MARKAGVNSAETSAAIRKSSIGLFASLGYAAVSMRRIADRVGVQPSALYKYHPTKQQLLVDVMCGHMEQLLMAWQKARPTAALSAVTELDGFARFHIRYHIERPDEVFISYMELRSLEAEGFKKVNALRGDYEAVLKDILTRGMHQGVFTISDPHVVAMAILAMITGVNTWYRSGGRLALSKIEDIYVNMVLGSVGCPDKEGVHV